MSKIKAALVTMFALATSSAAMASSRTQFSTSASVGWSSESSVRTRDHRFPPRTPQIRDHRSDDYGNEQLEASHSWMLLGTVNRVVNAGTALDFSVGRYRSISMIKLQSNGGKSRILDVKVNFANGTTKTMQIDRYVGDKGSVDLAASPTYTINLDTPRRVASITIDGLNATNSSYSLFVK